MRTQPLLMALFSSRVRVRAALAVMFLATWCVAFGQQSAPAARDQAAPTALRESPQIPAITEEELRQQLLGKTFYLRDGYLENNLRFDENGKLEGSSPKASYTLSLVEIQRVHLEKHKLELEAMRYGLHFLGASATEDQAQALDKVRLTSKKKPLRIVIAREVVVTPKKAKPEKHLKGASVPVRVATESDVRGGQRAVSQEQANRALRTAMDRVFSPGIDETMIAGLPDYWKLYYKAVAEKSNYRPADAAVLRQSQVDQKARLLSALEPASNEFAQNNGVAGAALYYVVLDANGRPSTIAIGRPIGFGLDESAVESIRGAKFQPAIKGGAPVPVLLDVTVQFRIYSKRTAAVAEGVAVPVTSRNEKLKMPGPYTRTQLEQQQKAAADAAERAAPVAPSSESQQKPASQSQQPELPQQPTPQPPGK